MEATGKGMTNEIGSIKINEEVVAIIAGMAATEVPGVAGMSGLSFQQYFLCNPRFFRLLP